jgi:tetratricopeptide (TPR) repeat protein
MKGKVRIAIVAAAGLAILFGAGCDKLKSRDRLNKGVQAFRNARYTEAVDMFKEAIQLDPNNPNAKVYLATAYMSQWIPGADSPENKQLADAARKEFLEVLQKDPKDKNALASLAFLAYNEATNLTGDEKLKKFDEAREWHLKTIEADPKNKTAYYSLGVIDWGKWYPALMAARAKLGMRPEDPGPLKDKKVREELKAKYSPIIQDGIDNLQKALQVDPEYDEAMAYMNLLVRERADLADTPQQYQEDIKTADNWVQKTLDTKKLKASRQPAGSVTAEETK